VFAADVVLGRINGSSVPANQQIQVKNALMTALHEKKYII
jgi:hypothetical protein